jgi:pimeloyl-ACP methyl ester carboxylesterase
MTTLVIIVVILGAGAVITAVGVWLIARAHPPRGRFIAVDGLNQHIVELGAARGDGALPVVLLHGAGANLEDMAVALGERLAAHHRVILIDRPGFGWSKRKGKESSSPAVQAGVLRDVLRQLGIERAILVGHSWGGTVALAFALAYPQQAAGLVLLAPPTHPMTGSRLIGWNNAVLATPIGWLFAHTLALPLGAPLIAPGVRLAFLPQAMPLSYVKRSAALLILRPASLMANWADVGGLGAFLTEQSKRYGTLAVPIIALVGDRDALCPAPQHCGELAAVAPNVKLTLLPGLGHMLHHGAADAIVAAVEELASASSPLAGKQA